MKLTKRDKGNQGPTPLRAELPGSPVLTLARVMPTMGMLDQGGLGSGGSHSSGQPLHGEKPVHLIYAGITLRH